MFVTIERGGCIGCMSCVGICPEVFSIDSDGETATAIDTEVPSEHLEAVQQACRFCPVDVIYLDE